MAADAVAATPKAIGPEAAAAAAATARGGQTTPLGCRPPKADSNQQSLTVLCECVYYWLLVVFLYCQRSIYARLFLGGCRELHDSSSD